MGKPLIMYDIISGVFSSANSQKEAAKILGVDPSTLSRAVTGDRGIISTAGKIVVSCWSKADE